MDGDAQERVTTVAAGATAFTVRAVSLADAFDRALAELHVAPGYRAEMTRPDGPSTGGGERAWQRIRLVPKRPDLPLLVIGAANAKDATAELRSWRCLDAIHRGRFGASIPLDRTEYAAVLAREEEFCRRWPLAVRWDPTPDASPHS